MPRPAAMSSSALVIAPVPSLHGGHCPHDSTYKNRERTAATSTMHTVSSYTMNPAAPRPVPAAANASNVSGMSSCASVSTALVTPGSTARMVAIGSRRSEHCQDFAQRRAELDFGDAGPLDVADDRAHDCSRRSDGAERPIPRRAVRKNVCDIGQRLDVVDRGRVRLVSARVSGLGFVRLPAQLRRGREQAMYVWR